MMIAFIAAIVILSLVIIAVAIWKEQRTPTPKEEKADTAKGEKIWQRMKMPQWESVKKFVIGTMTVVLFIGASLVLFYGAVYLKNQISADSSTTRTIVATPQGTQVWVPSGCDFRYYSDHKVLVKNKHNEGGSGTNVEFGVDSANAKLTFFSTEAQSVPVKFTTVCN